MIDKINVSSSRDGKVTFSSLSLGKHLISKLHCNLEREEGTREGKGREEKKREERKT